MKKLLAMLLAGFLIVGFTGSLMAAEKGTAAEAEALVKKAIEFYKANGKDKTFAEFQNAQGQFIKGDLYLFAWDMNCNVVAHGTNPKLIGKNMTDLKDPDGKRFVYDGVELAKSKGKGWVDYKWSNPTTNKLEAKSTYVEKADENLIFCCGIYK